MPTTIINPASTNNSPADNGMGFLLGVVILIAFVFILFIYGLPVLRQALSGLGNGGVNITLPKTVDVKVQQSK